MILHPAKEFCIAAFDKPDFIHREHIHWRWDSPDYANGRFGNIVGPGRSFFDAGLHELAHCIDFMMLGKKAHLQFDSLFFARPYSKEVYLGGRFFTEVAPTTSRGSWAEIRAWAISLLLMKYSFGAYYHAHNDNGVRSIAEVSLDELADELADAHYFLDDHDIFAKQRIPSCEYAERKAKTHAAYVTAIMQMLRQYDNPFGERRIKNALDQVNNRLGKLIHDNSCLFHV